MQLLFGPIARNNIYRCKRNMVVWWTPKIGQRLSNRPGFRRALLTATFPYPRDGIHWHQNKKELSYPHIIVARKEKERNKLTMTKFVIERVYNQRKV